MRVPATVSIAVGLAGGGGGAGGTATITTRSLVNSTVQVAPAATETSTEMLGRPPAATLSSMFPCRQPVPLTLAPVNRQEAGMSSVIRTIDGTTLTLGQVETRSEVFGDPAAAPFTETAGTSAADSGPVPA